MMIVCASQKCCRRINKVHARSIFNWFKSHNKSSNVDIRPPTTPYEPSKSLDNAEGLFHPMATSPVKYCRERAEATLKNGVCPISREKINYECPISGFPTHHSRQEWESDKDHQETFSWRLRMSNEDEHDLRGGRDVPELLQMPKYQNHEFALSFLAWDTFLISRGFTTVSTQRSLRHISRFLTYPITVGSILHPLSPYAKGDRLTTEGLRSMRAIRFAIENRDSFVLKPEDLHNVPVIRVFIVGARAETCMPMEFWRQGLTYLFPANRFHLIFVGPDCWIRPESCIESSDKLSMIHRESNQVLDISYYKDLYHTLHDRGDLAPFDPYLDIFFMCNPGLSHPATADSWQESLVRMLETKCPIVITGFSKQDMTQDVQHLEKTFMDEFDYLISPGTNPFASLFWDWSDQCPSRSTLRSNYGLYAIRGKLNPLTMV